MIRRRLYWPLAILVAVQHAGCRDATTALSPPLTSAEFRVAQSTPPILQQSSSAPALETYQTSVWLTKEKAASVTVRYQNGDPFLQFEVPKDGLVAGAAGSFIRKGDSILVTLTIDPVNFAVDFQPSGLIFSSRSPANVTFWYANANLDFNGNGVVDGSDRLVLQQLTLWYAATSTTGYKVSTKNDPSQWFLSGPIYHFSSYAVSW